MMTSAAITGIFTSVTSLSIVHSKGLCCRGFWDAHKDEFPAGQIAQRLCLVQFVTEDTLT